MLIIGITVRSFLSMMPGIDNNNNTVLNQPIDDKPLVVNEQ